MNTRARIALTIAVAFGAVCIPMGAYTLWTQHSGVLAPVTVVECHHAGRGQSCTGRWQNDDGARTAYIVAAQNPDIGDVAPMRIHDGKAYSTSPLFPLVFFGVGAVLLGGTGCTVVAARRRAPTHGP